MTIASTDWRLARPSGRWRVAAPDLFRQFRTLASPTRYRPYLLAAALFGGALVFTLILQHADATRPTLFLFFGAIVASAWRGGLGPGLLAAAMSMPAGFFFYEGSLRPHAIGFDYIVLSVFFVFCAGLGATLNAWQERKDERLRMSHAALAGKAAELEAANRALREQIAERTRAEAALRDAHAELMRIERVTTMGQLSASIAHEVNQPLTAVISSAGSCVRWLGASPANLAEARAAAQRIVRDATRASEIIGHIRAMVRRGMPEREALSVNDLLSAVLAVTEREIQARGARLDLDLGAGLPRLVGDRVQLQQLFLNLVMNALDAMADVPRARVLSVASRQDGCGQICVSVRDTGAGIACQARERLFDPFVTTKPTGMGLGLSICQTIAETHAGAIAVSHTSDAGTTFTVTLPLDEDADG